MSGKTRTRKMVNLSIEETSGVDHPAHLHEGWLVMKSADSTDVQQLLDTTLNQEVSDMEYSTEERLQEALDALVKSETRVAELEDIMAKSAAVEPESEEAAEVAEVVEESAAPAEDDILKSAPESVIKMVEDLRKQADQAAAEAAMAKAALFAKEEAAADAEAITKASGWSHLNLDAAKVGPALRQLAKHDEELAKAVEEILVSVNAQAESANIFAEIGKSANYGTNGSAIDRMTAMAKRAVTEGVAPSFEQALSDIALNNPDLYSQYMSEKR